jgi:predicted transcriptional regulator
MTATIQIEDELKARVEAAAAEAGKTADAFVLDAITERVEEAEENAAFHRLADERWAEVQATGLTVSWDEMNEWLEARLRGETPPRPVGRPLRR